MNAEQAAPEARNVARWSAFGYTGVSLALAAAFYAAASLIGSYTEVSRIGGSVWVFLLSMIVSMPLVTSAVKARITEKEGVRDGH
jgi:hypothetical protein